MNPSQVSARKTEGGARFDTALFATVDALEEANIPFAMIGGIATSGMGRPRSTHDIDLFVSPENAEAVIQVLGKKGFRTEKFDVEYGWEGNTLQFSRGGVDGHIAVGAKDIRVTAHLGFLLFAPKGPIEREIHRYLDEEFG